MSVRVQNPSGYQPPFNAFSRSFAAPSAAASMPPPSPPRTAAAAADAAAAPTSLRWALH